ncbi:MAG: MBL fold metallo-hydrolase, partial [Smithellaceae bacterium]|nr:MBL fold metallo-hydrolase [Smithellaceae bacterium]
MENTSFGAVEVIHGENMAKFPCCNSLFINGDVKALIDPGSGRKTLEILKERSRVDVIVNTHYHFDHIAYNYLFEEAKIFINSLEAQCFRNRIHIGTLLVMRDVYG